MYDPRYLQSLVDELNDIDKKIYAIELFLYDHSKEDLTDWKSSFKKTAKCEIVDMSYQLRYMNGYRECLRNRIVAYLDSVAKG